MPSLSDFLSLSVFVQAALVGVGVTMAWRGLHLSGDKGILKVVWSLLCVASFLGALFNAAVANHDSIQAIREAQHDRQAATDKLNDIQESLAMMNAAMAKIAGAARVDPNQPAQSLADQIIGKLAAMEKQIAQTESRVSTLENPPHDPDSLYQGKRIVAKFVRGMLSADHRRFEFTKIYNANDIDFSKRIGFRNLVLKCQPHGINTDMEFDPGLGAISNVMDGVVCTVVSDG